MHVVRLHLVWGTFISNMYARTHMCIRVHTCCIGTCTHNRTGAKKVKNIELELEVRLDPKDNIQVDLGYGSF